MRSEVPPRACHRLARLDRRLTLALGGASACPRAGQGWRKRPLTSQSGLIAARVLCGSAAVGEAKRRLTRRDEHDDAEHRGSAPGTAERSGAAPGTPPRSAEGDRAQTRRRQEEAQADTDTRFCIAQPAVRVFYEEGRRGPSCDGTQTEPPQHEIAFMPWRLRSMGTILPGDRAGLRSGRKAAVLVQARL